MKNNNYYYNEKQVFYCIFRWAYNHVTTDCDFIIQFLVSHSINKIYKIYSYPIYQYSVKLKIIVPVYWKNKIDAMAEKATKIDDNDFDISNLYPALIQCFGTIACGWVIYSYFIKFFIFAVTFK